MYKQSKNIKLAVMLLLCAVCAILNLRLEKCEKKGQINASAMYYWLQKLCCDIYG